MSTEREPVDPSTNGAFDIAEQEREAALEDKGAIVPITDIRGKPAIAKDGTPVTWHICGINSKKWQEAEDWQQKDIRRFRGRPMTDDERRKHNAEFLARCSLGFTGFGENGNPLPFTTANATQVLVRLPFIARQLQGVMGDHDVFTQTASNG